MRAWMDLRELRSMELEALHKELIEKLQFCINLSQQDVTALSKAAQAQIIAQLSEIERETTELAAIFGIEETKVDTMSQLVSGHP